VTLSRALYIGSRRPLYGHGPIVMKGTHYNEIERSLQTISSHYKLLLVGEDPMLRVGFACWAFG